MPSYSSDAARVFAKSHVAPDGCWIWQGTTQNQGYGRTHGSGDQRGRRVLAHRFSYEVFVGPIPEGMQIDHLCRTRLCVNPDHLEPVDGRTNILRSPLTLAGINAAKTHCNAGHEFSDENTYVRRRPGGRSERVCRTCKRKHLADHAARRNAARAAA